MKSLSELPAYPGDFVRRRLITFVGIVLGYSCFYLTRNSLTYTAPVMVRVVQAAAACASSFVAALFAAGLQSWLCSNLCAHAFLQPEAGPHMHAGQVPFAMVCFATMTHRWKGKMVCQSNPGNHSFFSMPAGGRPLPAHRHD